ncbi:unnamed protein product [Pedinophyceae sp. YPF-701]|nr:unnamed protein product [Pedinophyceae sp. YPF-701]
MHAAGPRAHHQGSLRSRAAPQSRTSARRSPRVLEALQRPAHARHCQAPRRQAAERTQAALLGRRGVARRHTAAAPSPQRAGMPVSAQHTWEEEDGSLVVHVRVAGVPRSKIDVFASDCYIKVNAPPYFFQVDLRGEIDEEQSAATIEPSGIVFRAVKVSTPRPRPACPRAPAAASRSELALRRPRPDAHRPGPGAGAAVGAAGRGRLPEMRCQDRRPAARRPRRHSHRA